MLNRKKVILDVDTGSDDAVAIMLAVRSEELEILGITVTWGNRPVENCAENTLRVLELLGKEIPVYQGCPQPMVRYLTKQRNAALEKDGISAEIDGQEVTVHPAFLDLLPAVSKVQKLHACSFLVETLKEVSEKITLIPVGPLTNIGMALRMAPEIKEHIEEIVLMGGGVGRGNITAIAEANFYHDPEAAKIVLDSGIPCRIVGLNATHSAELTLENAKTLREMNTPSCRFAAELVESRIFAQKAMGTGNGFSDAIHDAVAVACVVCPEIVLDLRRQRCDVDINGGAADGELIADNRIGYEADDTVTTQIVYKVDQKQFFELLCRRLSLK